MVLSESLKLSRLHCHVPGDLSELSCNLLDRGRRILVVEDLSSLLVFPVPALPLFPVTNSGGARVDHVCIDLIAVLRSEVLDLGRLAIDLGVQVRNLLTSRPKRHDGMFRVFDGLGIGSCKPVQALRQMIDGTGTALAHEVLEDIKRLCARTLNLRDRYLVLHLFLVCPDGILLQRATDITNGFRVSHPSICLATRCLHTHIRKSRRRISQCRLE